MNSDSPTVALLDCDPFTGRLEQMARVLRLSVNQYIAELVTQTLIRKRKIMLKIHPDRLNGDIIAEVRSADRNHLVQLSHREYLAASSLADQLSTSINNLLLWLHVPDSGVRIEGQDVAAIEEMALNVALLDGNQHGKEALQRQAYFRRLSIEEYIRLLLLKDLEQDEANSIFDPQSGAVLARRDRFGSLLKSTRNPQVNSIAH